MTNLTGVQKLETPGPEVCTAEFWQGGDEECMATPLEQCLAECDEQGKGLYEVSLPCTPTN